MEKIKHIHHTAAFVISFAHGQTPLQKMLPPWDKHGFGTTFVDKRDIR